jgi:Tfp pilus assembly protein FimT
MTRAAALDNRLTKADTVQASLQEEQIALQDRLATLESRDRLFAVANKLNMRDPQAFVIVNAPGPVRVSEHAPILSALVSWLHRR